MTEPLLSFTSHIAGKNARVELHPDRLEWVRTGSTIGRVATATATMGVSLLAGRKEARETVLVRSISNVSMKRDGLINSIVSVSTAAQAVDFRCSHGEAKAFHDALLRVMAVA